MQKSNGVSKENPEAEIIRLGIGDVTQPLAPAILKALHKAVEEMGNVETFRGYAPEQGYEFLRNVISEQDYRARGCEISPEEIFISDARKVTAEIYRKYLEQTTGGRL